MQKHHGTRRKLLEGVDEWFEREADSLGIIVWVCEWLNADVPEDGEVIN